VRVDVGGELPLVPRSRRPMVTATLRVENLLDRRFREVANFDAPGRSVLVGVRVGR